MGCVYCATQLALSEKVALIAGAMVRCGGQAGYWQRRTFKASSTFWTHLPGKEGVSEVAMEGQRCFMLRERPGKRSCSGDSTRISCVAVPSIDAAGLSGPSIDAAGLSVT